MVPDDLNRRAALALLLGGGALAATGCGFALRKAPEFAFRSIYVDLPANSSIGNELRRQLQGTGKLEVIQDAARRDQAEVLLQSVLDVRDRIVVGRDASGQVREFQLRQRFRFRVRTPAGKEVLPAAEILRRTGSVELIGPAVIDFEYYATLALVNRRVEGLRYDILSSLLYVDRRGAPESRQLGLDTVDKVVLLRAIAEAGRASSERCWITEVNWPLREGPHSPAGRSVSVDEDTQASFLVRYDLLALGTGLVERVYWWQLVARGYGLMVAGSDGTLVARPGYHALRELNRRLDGATFHGPLPAPAGVRLYRFTRDDGELVVGWAPDGPADAELPRPPVAVHDRDGVPLSTPPGRKVTFSPSPCYFELGHRDVP